MFNPASGTNDEGAQRVTLPRKPAAAKGLDGDGATVPAKPAPAKALDDARPTLPMRPTAVEPADGKRPTLAARPVAPEAADAKRATLAARPVETQAPDPDQLLQQSTAARDPEEALEYAQRAAELSPDDPKVQATLQRAMLAHLNRDAFVAFLAETPKTYVVNLRHPRPRVVPKTRAQPEVFPPTKRTPGEHLWVLVWWLILGLVPAGVGAVLLSPIVFQRALATLGKPDLTPRDHRLALAALAMTILLGLLGLAFTLLLILHTIG